MSSMKKTKEGINLKKLLRLKNTGSIFVIAGLLMIFVIASYTYILQSSYTKTALETEITRDTASADAVHKLVNGRIGKEDFDQIKDQSDEKKQLYKDISSYFNEIRTLNSTRYIYTAQKNEEGKLVYVVDGLNSDADDVRTLEIILRKKWFRILIGLFLGRMCTLRISLIQHGVRFLRLAIL